MTAAPSMVAARVAAIVGGPSRGRAGRRLRTVMSPTATGVAKSREMVVVAVAVGAAVGGLIWGWGGALAAVAVSAAALARDRLSRVRREQAATRVAVVALCRAIASELRSGHPAATALSAAVGGAPPSLAATLQTAITVARRGDGDDLAEALAAAGGASSSRGVGGLRHLAACWRVAAVSGVSLATAIDRVADALQDEIDVGRDVDAVLAGPQATVRLLAGLPALGVLLGSAIGAKPLAFLFGSVPGLGCVVAAAMFDAAGIAWSRRIARRAAAFS